MDEKVNATNVILLPNDNIDIKGMIKKFTRVDRREEHNRKHAWRRSVLMALCLMVLLAMTGRQAQAGEMETLQIHQPKIGCANCHLLIAGDTVILVDGGTDTDVHGTPDYMLSYIAATGIDHINAHFVTHYHNDHAMQIDDFSALYGREDTVVYGPSVALPDQFLPLPNGSYRQLLDGEELDIGPFHVECVGPEYVRADGLINPDSLNFVVTYGEIRMLFTGDFFNGIVGIHHPEEISNLDILVFPHHGLEPFPVQPNCLKLANPKIVLLPGAAEAKIRTLFDKYGMKPEVYGAYARGNVVLLSDGKSIEVMTEVEPGAYVDAVRGE